MKEKCSPTPKPNDRPGEIQEPKKIKKIDITEDQARTLQAAFDQNKMEFNSGKKLRRKSDQESNAFRSNSVSRSKEGVSSGSEDSK